MLFPPELLLLAHVLSATLLTTLMGIATVFWIIRMRGVGGVAGNYFSAFFFLIFCYAILQGLYPIASSAADATFLGALTFLAVNTAFLYIFLAGEYSTTDRPSPWRVTSLGIAYGTVWVFLVITIIVPPGAGPLYMTYFPGFGWVLFVTPIYLTVNAIFAVGALSFFLEFCVRAYRAAPQSQSGAHARKLLSALVIGFFITGAGVAGGWYFTDYAVEAPIATMVCISLSMLYAFSQLAQEYRIMFLLPHKATCLFVLNTSGVVYYDYMFQRDEDPLATIDLFAPALAAVNFIVQESLQLKESDWIQEFHTDERTFLLEVRGDCDLVGILIVSKPTQMLRKALVHFIDNLTPIWRSNNNQLVLDSDEILKINQIMKNAFTFILN